MAHWLRALMAAGLLALVALPARGISDGAVPVKQRQECCKVCHKGKACGNTCIRRDYQCHQPPGCACDG